MLLQRKMAVHKRARDDDDESMFVEEFPHRISKIRLDPKNLEDFHESVDIPRLPL